MIDIDTLEALAKAATPGPWMWDEYGTYDSSGVLLPHEEADCRYIAAANPTVVLELITELRREREKYKHAAIRYQEECDVRDWLAQHFGKIEKCKTCRELPNDIVTVNDCIQCVVEYARENMGGKDD